MSDRYDRQERIEGWDQTKLETAYVAVVGAGPVAQAATLCMAGLGVGELRIFDNARVSSNYLPSNFQMRGAKPGESMAKVLEQRLQKFNPIMKIKGLHWKFDQHYFADAVFGRKPDVVLDCTNDPYQELILYAYGQANGIPVVNTSANENKYELAVLMPDRNFKVPEDFYLDDTSLEKVLAKIPYDYIQAKFRGEDQKGLASLMVGGLATDQVRKFIMPLDEADRPLRGIFRYNELSKDRIQLQLGSKAPIGDVSSALSKIVWPDELNIVIVGAGSIGNSAGLALAVSGGSTINAHIFDKDEVEEVNLNRQVLFKMSDIGRNKVDALAQTMNEINGNINVFPHPEFFTADTKLPKPDAILVCTDSFRSRKLVNDYAKLHGIPLISGGTNFSSFDVVNYVPGTTRCLCEIDVDVNAEKEAEAARHSCIHVVEPSVIIPNWLAGVQMVMQIPHALSPADHDPVSGRITGSIYSPNLMNVQRKPICDCADKMQKQKKRSTRKKRKPASSSTASA
ncbi:hypothetical protein HOK51_04885 [Candidatus Woesearchaeota archaeon]|jgi:molybdopterin/thiamine biosynthesis adenylyltransferase|nr:hypothetical protein [Candidatus Woesearchaeota archaeon]MBT6519161.1 hypothetical protein [Candidatus Woesearchaeota archaeon]MBT7367273.1 hypothetical protein [Candidatus Woesearchaeota archaeon]